MTRPALLAPAVAARLAPAPARARAAGRAVAVALALAVTSSAPAGCSAAAADAGRAETLLERGDYAGARLAVDRGLQRAPRDARLRRLEMRALLAGGDARGAVAAYRRWRDARGRDDADALRALARTTLWQALRAHAPAIQTAAVQAVERLELEELAPEVARLMRSDDDVVAAAAGSALLTAHENAPQLLVSLLGSGDPAARALATDGIGRKAGAFARGDLVPMLGDRDPGVRGAAAAAVGRFAEGEDLARLVAMARRDADGRVRARVLRALAGRGVAGAVALGRAAAADPYLGARQAAVDLLARADSPAAAAALDELTGSGDRQLALAAAAARLRRGQTPAALAALERALADPSWPARVAAINAAGAAPRRLALTMAGRGVADARPEVRLAAARLLLALGQAERARGELLAALSRPDRLLQLDAATDLARLGDARGEAVLDRLAGSESPELRAAAVSAHAAIARVTPGLVGVLADARPELRLAAAEAILRATGRSGD